MAMKQSGNSRNGHPYAQNIAGDISVIKFEGVKVRVLQINGEPWFIAKDVCAALELTDHIVPLRRLGFNEKGEYSIPTLGGIHSGAGQLIEVNHA